jgi:group I intron endonuclease
MVVKKQSGIYQIRNLINNKVYIGKSVNINNRKTQHFSSLRNNKHKNFKLQGSVNKHGIDNFVFEILELCEEIDIKEIEYINKYNSCKNGYNISSEKSHMSKKWISKLKYLRKNDNKYIEQFNNFRLKADESNRVKINEYDLNGNFIKTWDSIIEASRFYNHKCNSLIMDVLKFKRSKISNKMFRYYNGETSNIKPYQSFRKTKLRFIKDNKELIFQSGLEAANYFNTSRANISLSLKKGSYKDYNIEQIKWNQ